MHSRKPDKKTRRQLLKKAGVPPELLDTCDAIFETVLTGEYLLHKEAEPLSHPIMVLGHILECALVELKSGNLTMEDVFHTALLALLHDICSYTRITEETIDATSVEQRSSLIAENRKRVIRHMEDGAKMARTVLHDFNDKHHRTIVSETAIEKICAIIAIHDNPKIGIPIPKDNHMAVMLREADRLDMISPSGVLIDLQRKQGNSSAPYPDNITEQVAQVQSNLQWFREERLLYNDRSDGPFCDASTFFRISQAYAIYERYLHHWRKTASDLGIPFDYGK